MTASRALRCAIYTRKSSEEGLEQSFNSLHAQREACEAYIRSQAGEGWRLRRDRYDDGGFSGGQMDRPALRRLLSDVAERRIDVVVVYKVDRLTRSLTDFAKIVDAFDKAGVAFVSVTQAFNTTTSMGRLTLNVLLSFAQFEREITGERIRDKIAASKAKGMWMKALFGGYVEAKQRQNVLDYDDLLLYWAQAVTDPQMAAEIGGRFDHVLVDEYQDTNRLQASILLALKPDGRGLTVVGDDAQSIYAFRAATVRNILDFPDQFSPPATVMTLDRNYRSTQPILSAANAVIDLAAERFTKNLWTERQADGPPRLVSVRSETDQARYVIEQVLERREAGTALKQQAVLFRTSSHSGALEVELTRRNIPYVKFGGLKFLDAAHVKDVMSVLRFVENPRDRVVGFRVMQLLPGVGPVSAQRVLDHISSQRSPIAALPSAPSPARVGADWRGFLALVGDLASGDLGWPAELERARQWYEPHLDRIHEDGEIRLGDLLQLEQIAAGYPSRERFLTDLTLDPPDATSDQSGVPLLDEDYLILSTIHSAKGQEWTSVFVLNAVDGCLPSDLGTGATAEIEEERRLLYVAMTRAKDDLHIMLPQRFFVHGQPALGDRHVYASRTRFIPKALLDLFEKTSWPLAEPATPVGPAQPPRVDVAERLRGMWR